MSVSELKPVTHDIQDPTLPTLMDRVVGVFSPQIAFNRQITRARIAFQRKVARNQFRRTLDDDTNLDSSRRGYDGSRYGYRSGTSYGSLLAEPALLDWNIEDLQTEVRHLVKNDPYASSLVRGRVDNVVGDGVKPQSLACELPGFDQESVGAYQQKIESLWERDSITKNVWASQRLLEANIAQFGEGIAIVMMTKNPKHKVPVRLSVICPTRLETPPDMASNQNVRMGIRYDVDETGERIPREYYFRKNLPNDVMQGTVEDYIAVPAARVYHVFEKLFQGQERGIPWLAPVIRPLYDVKAFKEFNLQAEKIAATHAMFFSSPADPLATRNNRRSTTDAYGNSIEDVRSSQAWYLPDDAQVTFMDPNRPGGTLGPYIETQLRAIAAGTRYPFALLAKLYDNSYSGGRLELIDGYQAFAGWHKLHTEGVWQQFLSEWWIPAAYNMGHLDEVVSLQLWLEYEDELVRNKWSKPRRPWIDPAADVKAYNDAIATNIGTEHMAADGRGVEWEDIRNERQREKIRDANDELSLREHRQSIGLDPEPDKDIRLALIKAKFTQEEDDREEFEEEPVEPMIMPGQEPEQTEEPANASNR